MASPRPSNLLVCMSVAGSRRVSCSRQAGEVTADERHGRVRFGRDKRKLPEHGADRPAHTRKTATSRRPGKTLLIVTGKKHAARRVGNDGAGCRAQRVRAFAECDHSICPRHNIGDAQYQRRTGTIKRKNTTSNTRTRGRAFSGARLAMAPTTFCTAAALSVGSATSAVYVLPYAEAPLAIGGAAERVATTASGTPQRTKRERTAREGYVPRGEATGHGANHPAHTRRGWRAGESRRYAYRDVLSATRGESRSTKYSASPLQQPTEDESGSHQDHNTKRRKKKYVPRQEPQQSGVARSCHLPPKNSRERRSTSARRGDGGTGCRV